MNNLRTQKIILGAVAVILLIAIAGFYSWGANTKEDHRTLNTASYRTLKDTSTDFISGIDAANRGELFVALPHFVKALEATEDPRAKDIIRINHANALMRLATTTELKRYGVSVVGKLASRADADPDLRAYASLAPMRWYNAYGDEEIFQATFQHPSFATFASTSHDESIVNLYRHILDLYPLALPMLEVARYDLNTMVKRGASSEELTAFAQALSGVLSRADRDTRYVEEFGNSADLMGIYLARARLLAVVEREFKTKEYGDADESYEKAYQSATLNNASLTRGFILISRALYHLDSGDNVRAKGYLEQFASDPEIQSSGIARHFKSLSSASPLYSSTVRLAKLSPKFAESIRALGFSVK